MLSLEIDKGKIILVQGTAKNGVVEVATTNTIRTNEFDVGDGVEAHIDYYAKVIRDFAPKEKSNKAVCTVDADNILVRELVIPVGKKAEIEQMIKQEMSYTYNVSDTDIIQYKLLRETTDDSGKMLQFSVAVMPRTKVDAYYKIITDAGFSPQVLDLNMNSLAKLLMNKPQINGNSVDNKNILLLDFDNGIVYGYIFADGQEQFSREIAPGINKIDRSIAMKLNLTADKALKIRRTELAVENGNYTYEAARDHINLYLDDIINECNKMIRFFMNTYKNGGIKEIYTFGAGATIPGLNQYLGAGLDLPIAIVESFSNVKFPADTEEKEKICHYLNAIGALLTV